MKYIDLGLPSGTLWAAKNEKRHYTFKRAKTKFGQNLPTKEDFEELVKYCWKRWNYEIGGIEFMGDNGAKLFLPAAGIRYSGSICYISFEGSYWFLLSDDKNNIGRFDLNINGTAIFGGGDPFGRSVRLIKRYN